MPIYGYRCEACGEEVEVFQSMRDSPLRVCAACGGRLRKLLYPVGVQFKGSGFYSTDYRDGSSGNKARSETSSESHPVESGGSSEKKAESPAGKE